MRSLKPLLLNSLFLLGIGATAWAGQMASQNSDYVVTKDLFGAAGPQDGPSIASQDYTLSYAWGEPVSGNVTFNSTNTIISGYFGGGFGNGQTFTMVSSLVGRPTAKVFHQGQLQVGVPYDAPVQVTFSDQPSPSSFYTGGVQIVIAADHLGQPSNDNVPFTVNGDTTNPAITITPQGAWLGNTLYDIQLTQQFLSVGGFQLDQVYHVEFLTLLDHHQENVVLNPIVPAAASIGSIGPISVDIPLESLSDYSAVLFSRDPVTSPLQVDPKIIQEANDKARAAGGIYRVPLSIQEITAFDTNGNALGRLSKPAEISMNYGGNLAAPAISGLVRPQTLSLWALDQEHRLWVKLPASQNVMGLQTVSVPVGSLSVFALMGNSDGSASDSFAFPIPWRPHGPNAGTGAGQTGTEADGIIFSNLPSECSIKIYTITGDLVRNMHHSDANGLLGQEKWDVKTTHGDTVASGVYLWRVESSVDGKNGKLMVIR